MQVGLVSGIRDEHTCRGLAQLCSFPSRLLIRAGIPPFPHPPAIPQLFPNPQFDLALDIPILRAVLDNGEYARITSIAAANVAEAPEPPEGVQWLTLHYERAMAQLARAAALAAHGGAPPALPAVQEAAAAEAAEELSAGIAPTEDVSPTNVRVVVSLARAELELHQLVEGVGEPQPLARFSIEDLGIAFHNTEEVRRGGRRRGVKRG